MSDQQFLHDRKNGLEEAFFVKHNRELLERLQQKVALESSVELLAEATGIDDESMLTEMVELGISAQTVAALGLVPLVLVAWADGRIQSAERDALLEAASAAGIEAGSESFELLAGWLEEKPDDAMVQAWEDYVRALSATASEGSRAALRAVTLGRAEAVAQAAGGLLGVGRVSSSERQVLDRLAAAFE